MLQRLLYNWDNTSFYLQKSVFYFLGGTASVFALSFFWPFLFLVAQILLVLLGIAIVADVILLYQGNLISADRFLPARLSIGDDEMISISISNTYPFKVQGHVLDELPYQLQQHIRKREFSIPQDESVVIKYRLQPKERGEHKFGIINVFIQGPLQLVIRRYRSGNEQVAKVYPSYRQMKKYQLMAVSNNLQQSGVKRLRKLGHSLEFEQVKEYVRGDDFRTINWKATARRGDLMVNNYTDEKSQQIFCVINKGRVMKMPFEGMTLLDYAINASFMITGVALQKGDRAGLICYSKNIDTIVPAERKPTQLHKVMEALYNQQTNFTEPDHEKLFQTIRQKVSHRSLLVMFTNYESIYSLYRELPLLQKLAHYHLLLVVMFENTELRKLRTTPVHTTEDIYIHTIADKFHHEKFLMVKELRKCGIASIITPPKDLSINVLNKYLELKNRQAI